MGRMDDSPRIRREPRVKGQRLECDVLNLPCVSWAEGTGVGLATMICVLHHPQCCWSKSWWL